MKKIFFVMRDFRVGGSERLTLSLLHRLDRNRFEAFVVVVDEMGPLRSQVPADIPVISLHGKQGNALQFPFRIVRYSLRLQHVIVARKPDLVVTVNWFAGMLGCWNAQAIHKHGGKLIVEFHNPVHIFINRSTYGNLLTATKRFITSYFFRKADRIVALSKRMAKELHWHFGIAPDKIELIYNGIDIKSIDENSSVRTAVSVQSPYIIAIGRLDPEKGHEALIRAYRTVAAKIPHSLVIVGDGSQRRHLEHLAQQFSLKNRVAFSGALDNPFWLLKHADFLVLPSYWEAFPTVLLESLALEVPIVATACDGSLEILENGQYGLLVPTGDHMALSDAILKIASYPDQRERYRLKSRSRAEMYSLEGMVEEYEKLFLSLTESAQR